LKSEKQIADIDKLAKRPILFFIYADWCEHCKVMKPEWDKAKAAFIKRNDVSAVEVDSDAFQSILPKLKVSVVFMDSVAGYPTLLCVNGDKKDSYREGPDHIKITDWITQHYPKQKTATIVPAPKAKKGGASKPKAAKPKATKKPIAAKPKATKKPIAAKPKAPTKKPAPKSA
jgi:thioredoxin-like negative regulator of GroEL